MRNSFENALVELAPPRIDREYIVACGYNLRAIDTVMLVSVGFETGDKFKRDCNTCLYEANNFARATDLEIRLQINCQGDVAKLSYFKTLNLKNMNSYNSLCKITRYFFSPKKYMTPRRDVK